jgi:tetratricopeptide (TPR) repeat protein
MIDDKNIIRYLDGEMPEDEKLRFEKEISTNTGLAKRVDQYRKIQQLAGKAFHRADDPEEGLDPQTREKIRRAVKDFKESGKEVIPGAVEEVIKNARRAFEQRREKVQRETGAGESGPGRPNIRQTRRIWLIAAAIVVLALITSLLVFRPFRGEPAKDLFAAYYEEFTVTDKMHESARADDDLLFAIKVYEAGDYKRAIILFEMLADSSGLREQSLFYAGHAYLHLNLTDKAIETFQQLLENGPGELMTATRWYLALCYLKIGEAALAREQLGLVTETDSPHRRDARLLLRELQ